MPTLKKLTPEVKNALGNKYDFQARYEGLIQKSHEGQLKDNQDAVQYIDDVVKRYKMIKGTSPSSSDLQAKKETYLPLLRAHAAEVGIHTFSKPGDLASRLKELDFEPSKIEEISKGLEQAGDDDLLAILSSLIITSATCDDGHHHHHHHHRSEVIVSTPGYGSHHHYH
ncbi:coiled coil protein [Legionella sp. PATHC035]|uniref:coiled coil protein n=1 Tax=Legionella sp. PATHC035 TaxID=2992040 RepID=UPI0022440FFB|nr:coiled coil protein [Legionella sp. PATHC035]MCW8410042.1 coiled coil protein [Legionella sp. PATHC035]